MDYEKDIKIDESNLDLDWLEQPVLMMQYSRRAAAAKIEEDLANENLKVVEAELDKKIREDFADTGVKITEKVVQAAILTHLEHKTATQAVIDARYNTSIAKAAVQAFEHKKSALENLVRLHGQQYFAGPSVPQDLVEKKNLRDVERKEINKKVKIKRTKKLEE